MFLHHCSHCGRRELRGPRALTTDATGAFVAACRACGTVGPVLDGPAPASAAAPVTSPEVGPRVVTAA